jgi:hypothetical protein
MLRQKQNPRQEESRRDHVYAQRLNNIAASCIDSGQYDKAVAFLVKAMVLSPTDTNTISSVVAPDICTCFHCSLDECIVYSGERAGKGLGAEPHYHINCSSGACCDSESKKRKIDARYVAKRTFSANNNEDDNETIGFTHRTPILITPKIINEGHMMGPTLSLIVTFNLALANHLKLISKPITISNTTVRERLGKVLRLYELAYKWEGEFRKRKHGSDNSNTSSCNEKQELRKQQQQQDSDQQPIATTNAGSSSNNKCSSLLFDMIVCNNLSQIHRMAQNQSKQEKCLQHLLSILMFVVDWQRERGGYDHEDDYDDRGGEQHQQQQVDASPLEESNEVHNSNCIEMTSPFSSFTQLEEAEYQLFEEQRGNRKRPTAYMDLDGFWRNIVPFLLKNDCSEAA